MLKSRSRLNMVVFILFLGVWGCYESQQSTTNERETDSQTAMNQESSNDTGTEPGVDTAGDSDSAQNNTVAPIDSEIVQTVRDTDTMTIFLDSLQWVSLEGGVYTMGDVAPHWTAFPPHEECVPKFEIMSTEVTRAQYHQCVQSGICHPLLGGYDDLDDYTLSYPATEVSWEAAVTFCEWVGGELPSEAEWEYAARSGGMHYLYPWGELGPESAEYVEDLVPVTATKYPVCSFPGGNTEQGLCDMLGNVSEWTSDTFVYNYFQFCDEESSIPVDAVLERTVRGDYSNETRNVTWRTGVNETAEFSSVGFRCIRNREPVPCNYTPVELNPSAFDVTWIDIPGGMYEMGIEQYDAGTPVHTVEIQPFKIAEHETTIFEFMRCVSEGYCYLPSYLDDSTLDLVDLANRPINYVSWYDAFRFCEWLGARLPSESEWEYTARSGGLEWIYPWGNSAPTCEDLVVMSVEDGDCDIDDAQDVCTKPLGNTIHGVCDMAGNVAEWVRDRFHENYIGAPVDGSAWVLQGENRVTRGGSYYRSSGFSSQPSVPRVQTYLRGENVEYGVWSRTGFRCAK